MGPGAPGFLGFVGDELVWFYPVEFVVVGDVGDEFLAVEVVDFVLEDAGGVAGIDVFYGVGLGGVGLEFDLVGSGDSSADSVGGPAAFAPFFLFFGCPGDLGVDEYLEVGEAAVGGGADVYCDDAFGDADLRGG